MTVCKYYLQGSCHFGERCRFEHPQNNQQGFGGGGGSGGFGSNQGAFQNSNNRFAALGGSGSPQTNKNAGQQSIKDLSPREIADIVGQEMKVWDSSKMWPFSCFTYSKDGKCISGFEDLSPEELRMEAYERQKNNTFHLYQSKVSTLAQEYQAKRTALKTQPPDIKQKLLQEIQEHKSGIANASTGAFGSSQVGAAATSGLFGKQSVNPPAPQGLFGKPAATTQSQVPYALFGNKTGGGFGQASQAAAPAKFGSTPSVFGGPAPIGRSVFGGTPANQPIGATPTASPFGSSGVFGQQQQQQQQQQNPFQAKQPPTGLFGAAAPQSTGSVFGQASAPAPTGLFGKGTAPPQPAAFPGGSAPQPLLPPSSQPSGLFGKAAPAPAPTGLFGKPAVTSSVFGGHPSGQAIGGGALLTGGSQGVSMRAGLYTALDQLTEQEKSQFCAATFELGKIPIRPPPLEMV